MRGVTVLNTPERTLQLGEMLRRRREEMGLTQAELAGRIGIEQSRISRLESWSQGPNAELPRPELLNAVARELRLPIDRLLSAAGYDLNAEPELPDDDPSLALWMAEGEHLTPEERQRVVQIVKILRGTGSE